MPPEDGTTEVIDNSSAETTIPTDTPGTLDTGNLEFVVPEAYADKGWVKDVKDSDALWKLTDSLKSEIGKRPAGIPQENASDEDKAAFFKELGVPENGEGYELPTPGEEMGDYQKGVRDLFHKANITQEQAKLLDAGHSDLLKEFMPDPAEADAQFNKMTEDLFGANKEDILSGVNSLMAENSEGLPQDMKDHINKLPNKYLVPMAAIINNIKQKYINEDSLPPKGDRVVTGLTQAERIAEGTRLMALPEYSDKSNPKHAAVYQKALELFGNA